jgi:NADPH2:quinone reductase
MSHAIMLRAYGGPEALSWEAEETGAPGAGEIGVRHTAIGVNFIDTYQRTGLYPIALPACLGREAAGVIDAVGKKVRGFRVGDRVAYLAAGSGGAYRERRNIPAERAFKLPAQISDRAAAAMMLKGLTAWYLLRRTYRVRKGDTIVVHSAAGGVGLILCQWARHLGARVIGIVGSDEKAQLARKHGCRVTFIGGRDDWVAGVKKLTQGVGVPVVYDSVGKDTVFQSLDVLRPLGLMVSYGNSSGPVPPLAPLELSRRGSLYLTRPTLDTYVPTRAALASAVRELFGVVKSGKVKIRVGQTYALKDAAQAHRDLEARRTTGSTVLIP